MQELKIIPKNKDKPKSKHRMNKYIIYIISFVILVFAAIYYNHNSLLEWSGLLNNNIITQELEINKNVIDRVEGKVDSITDSLITSKTEESLLSDTQHYDNDTKISQTKIGDRLDYYRNYLLNINLLIINFLQDKIYTHQINIINPIFNTLPLRIQKILSNLDDYNTKFLVDINLCKNEMIFPQKILLIEKFIKIEKKSKCLKDKEILKSQIIKDLEDLIDFFYSYQFQQKFIE